MEQAMALLQGPLSHVREGSQVGGTTHPLEHADRHAMEHINVNAIVK
jgi:hypothetical protein